MAIRELNTKYNIMNISTIAAFTNIIGGWNQDCKDVYFVRAVGMNNTIVKDITTMDSVLGERMRNGSLTYQRLGQLPKLVSFDDVNFYSNCYLKWCESGKKQMCTKYCTQGDDVSWILGKACEKASQLLQQGPVNASIEKNFIVKLIFWFDWATGSFIKNWECRQAVKIVADNVVKKQEYLFFYLLTLVGLDVLLIQSREDIDGELEKLALSDKFILGEFGSQEIPTFQPAAVAVAVTEQSRENIGENGNARQTVIHDTTGSNGNAMPNTPSGNNERIRVQIPKRHSSAGPQMSNGCSPVASQVPGQHFPGMAEAPNPRREKNFEELALLASSVVKIAIHNNKGDVISTGSGIMVGRNGYILTNNHVAKGGMTYSVRIEEDENQYNTDELIKYNPLLDLAIIRIQRQLQPIPVYKGPQKLVRGQKVVAIGSPLGLFNSVSDGIISGFRKMDDVDMIQFTAPISPGSSGGAVLNMYGEVIGISTAGIDEGQNLNLAVGYEDINAFIRGFV